MRQELSRRDVPEASRKHWKQWIGGSRQPRGCSLGTCQGSFLFTHLKMLHPWGRKLRTNGDVQHWVKKAEQERLLLEETRLFLERH